MPASSACAWWYSYVNTADVIEATAAVKKISSAKLIKAADSYSKAVTQLRNLYEDLGSTQYIESATESGYMTSYSSGMPGVNVTSEADDLVIAIVSVRAIDRAGVDKS